jgi:hypothetical protein
MRLKLLVVGFLLGLASLSFGQSAPATLALLERKTVNAVAVADPSGGNWRETIKRTGARGLVIGVSDLILPEGGELIIERPGGRRSVARLRGDQARTVRWIPVLGAESIVLEIRGLTAGQPIRFTYQFGAAKPSGRPYSFQDPPRFDEAAAIAAGAWKEAAKSVAAVLWIEGGRWRVCTAFVTSQRHVLTNHHCIASQSQCDAAQIVFGYLNINGVVDPGEYYECKRVVKIQGFDQLDLSVLELKVPIDYTGVPPPLSLANDGPQIGQKLAVIQHPLGVPMKIVWRGCDVRGLPVLSPTSKSKTDVAHQCDTADGSSGSPVLNKAGKVVAIHHWGYGDVGFADLNRAIVVTEKIRDQLSKLRALP